MYRAVNTCRGWRLTAYIPPVVAQLGEALRFKPEGRMFDSL
jgi:hypothetical protein